MAFIVRTAEQKPTLEAGVYAARAASLAKKAGTYGESLQITFEIAKGEHAGVKLSAYTDLDIVPGRKTAKWLAALGVRPAQLERDAGSSIDISVVIGKPCRLLVVEKDGKNGSYSRIQQVMPPKGQATEEDSEEEPVEEEAEEATED